MGTVGGSRTVHAPLMRPLTPSSVGPSLHQMEHQLLEVEVQLENYTSELLANFELMRCQPLAQSRVNDGDLREKTLCNGYAKDDNDIDGVVTCVDKEERLSAASGGDEERRPASGHGSRPSTRGSRWGK